MTQTLRKYFHPFIGRILFWNAILLVLVKVVLPHSALQLASIIDTIPVFDSREIINLTNEVRTAQSLAPLIANSKLDLAASEKLTDMAEKEYFAHTSPDGTTPWFWMKKNQYQYSVAGENLAIGFFTADETVKAWLNSPSHKANILNSKYREIGVAAKAVQIGDRKGILVVQMFGLPASLVISTAVSVTPKPTPPHVAIVTPKPITTAQSQTQGATIENSVSTDIVATSVITPIKVAFESPENIIKLSGILNNTYMAYALLVAMLSALTFFLFERNRSTAFKVAFNFALFILAIVVPVSQISFQGLIF